MLPTSLRAAVLALAFACSTEAATVSLASFIPRIDNLPTACNTVYRTDISGCTADDFKPGATCTDACVQGLSKIGASVSDKCAGVDAGELSIIGVFQNGLGIQSLCPGVTIPAISSSGAKPSTKSSTGATTTQAPLRTTLTSSASTVTSTTSSSTDDGDGDGDDDSTSSAPAPTSTADLTLDPNTSAVPPASTAQAGSSSSDSTPTSAPNAQLSNSDSGGGSPFDVVATGSSSQRETFGTAAGGDETFRTFPSHVKALLQHALPKVTVLAITYPQFETRGDLHECVGRFKEWLQNKVIDLEVANSTPSPTVDPSVRTILVGHSMGGIVAAETLLSILADQPIHSQSNSQTAAGSTGSLSDHSTLMFPYIQGILAFDTPYLGIAPGVVAHGAEKHWNTASSAYSAYNSLADAFGWGAKDTASGAVDTSKMLPAPSASSTADVASAPLWQRYGKVAMFAGAAGAIAAGGAAAYMKKDQITQGVTWATSHLEFVGVLARPEEMRKRLEKIVKITTTQDLGFCNMYTTLGHAVNSENKEHGWTGKVAGKDRTFCNLPKGSLKNYFMPAVNDKATAETWAHMSMFEPRNNPGYYTLSETAKEKIIEWTESTDWYEESEGPLTGEVGEEAEI
ncbi:hypothetical protein PtrCC142_005196, partial [Pyrenophora tritici-repentis]